MHTNKSISSLVEEHIKPTLGTHQRCVGDMVTKKARFLRGSSLEDIQSAQAPMANSMASCPSNSSHAPFSSVDHLQKVQITRYSQDRVDNFPLKIHL